MRSGDGLALAAVVSREHPEITIIALSRLWDDGHVAESLGAGMAAHLPKTTPLDDLPALIRQATRGAEMRPASAMRSPVRTQITARERDVLRLAARGLSNVEIGRELFVTEQTVKFHLANIYRKLRVRNRTQASHAAAQAGMLG
jgi:DNA-binding NarL/FixJ family response regulator